jgi:F-type H+-transporting ATPase subunit gamma
MANVLDIKRRIRSVKSTMQITKAMKVVSAAKLRRAQDRAMAARPYAKMLTNVLRSLVNRAEVYDPQSGEPLHPLLEQRPERNILVCVVTADRGLAGGFNSNLIKAAVRFLDTKKAENIDLELVGRKGRDFFRRRYPMQDKSEERTARIRVTGESIGLLNKPDFETMQHIAEDIIGRYKRAEVDAVYIIFNEFKSVIAQRLVVDQILPIEEIGEDDVRQADELSHEERERIGRAAGSAGVSVDEQDTTAMDRAAAKFATADVDYIYEQPPAELFRSLLPRYIAVQMYRAVLESSAAEHAARMTAMDSATNNATDMIASLTLTMNRARQAAITKEIIEIVSGAAAL